MGHEYINIEPTLASSKSVKNKFIDKLPATIVNRSAFALNV
ncbi:hypothetical protein PTE01_30790 [Pseudoalteromonas tetraodonis GFC]|nr:hypothetical protein PTE01_30790 [Pseudoalteromonas tetraodonis GFC]